MKAKNIQEYFGTLQQSVVTSWRKHLKTGNHAEHVILNDFYDDILDAVDELIEGYMSKHGKIDGYVNLLDKTKKMSGLEYIQALYDFTKDNRNLVGEETELQGCVDDVLSVMNSSLYKLKELVKESNTVSLSDYISEMLNESEFNPSLSSHKKAYNDFCKWVNKYSKQLDESEMIDLLNDAINDIKAGQLEPIN